MSDPARRVSVDEYVAAIVAHAPPLTSDQIDRLRAVFQPRTRSHLRPAA